MGVDREPEALAKSVDFSSTFSGKVLEQSCPLSRGGMRVDVY